MVRRSIRRTAPLASVARAAYRAHLEPHHGIWLRTSFNSLWSAVPSRAAFLRRLARSGQGEEGAREGAEGHAEEGGAEGEEEARERVYREMGALVQVQALAIATLSERLRALQLEDHRKA